MPVIIQAIFGMHLDANCIKFIRSRGKFCINVRNKKLKAIKSYHCQSLNIWISKVRQTSVIKFLSHLFKYKLWRLFRPLRTCFRTYHFFRRSFKLSRKMCLFMHCETHTVLKILKILKSPILKILFLVSIFINLWVIVLL